LVMKNRWILGALIAGVLAHVVLFAPMPLLAQALAVMVIAGFLPGALLIEALVGQSVSAQRAPHAPARRRSAHQESNDFS
ncbi:MAG: hypothetical protein R6W76_16990, partial [Caldilinea sp.]